MTIYIMTELQDGRTLDTVMMTNDVYETADIVAFVETRYGPVKALWWGLSGFPVMDRNAADYLVPEAA